MKSKHRWLRLTAILSAVLLAANAIQLISFAAAPEAPAVTVGDGTKTDNSDEWVLEFIEDTTYSRKIYYIKNKATGTYLTASSGWGTSNKDEFNKIELTLEEKAEGKNQKWKFQPQNGSGYLVYINDNHPLALNESGEWGMIQTSTYTELFTPTLKFDGTDETVKLPYKWSGQYLAVQLPGDDPEPEEQPAVTVGDGQKTDGSDEWVLEFIEDLGSYQQKRYYIKNQKTGTYLTVGNNGYASNTEGEFVDAQLTLEAKDESNAKQKWIVRSDGGGYLIYLNAQHNLTFSEDNRVGFVKNPNNEERFEIKNFQFDNTDETVKLNYKWSGQYLAVQLPGDDPEPEEQPAVTVGDGQKTDGSDEWVLEFIQDTTYSRKIYYIKSKTTGTYLTSSAQWGTAGSNQFDKIELTLEEKDEGKNQKWIFQPQNGNGYMVYIKDNHPLAINENNEFGLVNTSTYTELFTPTLKFDGTDETVKLPYKWGGQYLAVKLPGDDPEPEEGPAGEVSGAPAGTGGDSQTWNFEFIKQATSPNSTAKMFYIKNKATGLYLTADGPTAGSKLSLKEKGKGLQEWGVYYDAAYSHYYIYLAWTHMLNCDAQGNVVIQQTYPGITLSGYTHEDADQETTIFFNSAKMYLDGFVTGAGAEKDIEGSFGGYKDDTYTNGMFGGASEAFNLLANGGFENGTNTWGNLFGGCSYSAVQNAAMARSGQYALAVTGASAEYATPFTSLSQIIRQRGDGYYQMGVYVKAADGELPSNFSLRLTFTGSKGLTLNGNAIASDNETNFLTARTGEKDSRGYHKIFATFRIENTQGYSGAASLAVWQGKPVDFYLDDCFVYYTAGSALDGSFESDGAAMPVEGPFGEGVVFEKTGEAFRGESGHALKVTGVKTAESAPSFDITSLVKAKGDGVYELGAYVKALSGRMECFGVRLVVEGEGAAVNGGAPLADGYFGFAEVYGQQFIRVARTVMIGGADKITKAYLTFYPGEARGYYLDDVFVNFYYAEEMEGGYQSSVPQSVITRDSKTAVGAIRWDYWGMAPEQDAYVQNLNKEAYRWRLPWYAQVDQAAGTVSVPDYSQEIVDREIQYARQAGLDYWAFLLYKEPSDKALKYYLSSTKKDGMKWCAVLGLSGWYTDEEHMAWLVEEMYKPDYQTVQNGRPLIYAEGGYATMIRSRCKDKEKQPYIVSLLHTESLESAMGNDVDAISVYTQFGSGPAGSNYQNIVDAAEAKWNNLKETGVPVIANVTAGWDPRPRFENGMMGSGTHWNGNGDAKDIARNLENALLWTEANRSTTLANAILMYAWNEFDEGGWLCPTYQPENPEVPNTQRIEALQLLLNSETPTVIVTSESESDRAVYGMDVKMLATRISDLLRGKAVTWSVRPLTGNGVIDKDTGVFTGNKTGTVVIRATVTELPEYYGEFTLRVVAYTSDLYDRILYMKTVDGRLYPLEAWEEFQEAIRKAEATMEKENVSQEEVDAELRALNAALEKMKNAEFPENPVIDPPTPPAPDNPAKPEPDTPGTPSEPAPGNTPGGSGGWDGPSGGDAPDEPEPSLSPIGNALTDDEMARILPLTTGSLLRFQVTELGSLSPSMLQAVIDSGKPLQIEWMDEDGGLQMLLQLSDLQSSETPVDLTLLTADAETLARFFGTHAYAPLFFQSSQTLPGKMRVFLPNHGQFRKDEKMYVYLYENGQFTRTEIPVAITSDESMISFEAGYTDAFVVSPYREAANENTPPAPGTPADTPHTQNPTLLIVLLCVGGVLLAGGAVLAVVLIRRRRTGA